MSHICPLYVPEAISEQDRLSKRGFVSLPPPWLFLSVTTKPTTSRVLETSPGSTHRLPATCSYQTTPVWTSCVGTAGLPIDRSGHALLSVVPSYSHNHHHCLWTGVVVLLDTAGLRYPPTLVLGPDFFTIRLPPSRRHPRSFAIVCVESLSTTPTPQPLPIVPSLSVLHNVPPFSLQDYTCWNP